MTKSQDCCTDAEEPLGLVLGTVCTASFVDRRECAHPSGQIGTAPPRGSDSVLGSMQQFTADRMMRFITALGSDVEIAVHPGRRASGAGHLRAVVG